MKIAPALFKQALTDAWQLLFPASCHCGAPLLGQQQALGWCLACLLDLPLNPPPAYLMQQALHGRLLPVMPLGLAHSLMHYEAHSPVQHLLHDIKYRKRPQLATLMGQWLGAQLQKSGLPRPDLLLPVPIHPRKLKERGYNQALVFAEGIAQAWPVPIATDLLQRSIHLEAQARQAREQRFRHLTQAYQVVQPQRVAGRTICLVDDVITTGATIEALAHLLEDAGVKTVSVLAIASVN